MNVYCRKNTCCFLNFRNALLLGVIRFPLLIFAFGTNVTVALRYQNNDNNDDKMRRINRMQEDCITDKLHTDV